MSSQEGPVATVLIKEGQLEKGDVLLAGNTYGRVRTMTNSYGKKIKVATSSMPVEVVGLNDVPQAGDRFYCLGRHQQGQGRRRREQAAGPGEVAGRADPGHDGEPVQPDRGRQRQGIEPDHPRRRAGLGRRAEEVPVRAEHERSAAAHPAGDARRDHRGRRSAGGGFQRDHHRLQRGRRRACARRRPKPRASISGCTTSSIASRRICGNRWPVCSSRKSRSGPSAGRSSGPPSRSPGSAPWPAATSPAGWRPRTPRSG